MLHQFARFFILTISCLLSQACMFNCQKITSKLDLIKNKFNITKSNTKDTSSLLLTEEGSEMSIQALEHLANLNDPNACFKLGEIYFQGIGTAKDLQTGLKWYRRAAIKGLPIAMLQLGNIYRDGIIEPPSLTKAISWYEKAATAGNIKAMLILGEVYRGWYGMLPNYDKAMHLYIKAAGMGSLEAEYQMYRLITNNLINQNKYPVNINSILKSLKQSAADGNLDSMVALGDHYMQQPNTTVAINYYNTAAEQNFAPALLRLGLLHFHGEGVERNYNTAIEFFEKAAKLGNVVSEYHLGEIYRQGLGVERSAKTASLWYTKAANKNFPKALARLADLYFFGKGIKPNLFTAIELYNKAATLGDSYSGLLISIFYAKGLGVTQNLPLSVHWYNLVEQQQAQLIAKFDIAKLYESGCGFNKDYHEAARWYLLAANQGLAKAQAKLAELYATGLGVEQDYNQAIKWYKRAADQGYNYAQYSLALLLPKTRYYKASIAYNLMKKAALSGYKPAQYNLGLMHLHGNGTKKNALKAYSWLSIAINSNNSGLESSPELINLLTNNMDPEIRNKAVLLAQRYRDKYELNETKW